MNVESILNKFRLFEELVIESGFKRDLDDYIQAIQQPQNQNLVFLKDLSKKIQSSFIHFSNNSLSSELQLVLNDSESFMDADIVDTLVTLDDNDEIDAQKYFQQFQNILNKLSNSINSNRSEINTAKKVLVKYISTEINSNAENEKALVSLVFKDVKSTGNLVEFSKALNRWNRTLIVTHRFFSSETPEDISLVEIQNGSIDVIINLNLDVAVDFVELVKIGFIAYGAYLSYKSETAQEFIKKFKNNKKLMELEAQKETVLLDNIKESIEEKALAIHKERYKKDKKIENTSIKTKAKEISKVITDHIIKGNEVKLLTHITDNESDENNEEEKSDDISIQLREETSKAKEHLKLLDKDDKKLLIEKYGIKDEEEEN